MWFGRNEILLQNIFHQLNWFLGYLIFYNLSRHWNYWIWNFCSLECEWFFDRNINFTTHAYILMKLRIKLFLHSSLGMYINNFFYLVSSLVIPSVKILLFCTYSLFNIANICMNGMENFADARILKEILDTITIFISFCSIQKNFCYY